MVGDNMTKIKDVHTEHCCIAHGCKYGDDSCTVTTGKLPQSYLCMDCEEDSNLETNTELLKLIQQHTGLFADSVARRRETSTGNKALHTKMLELLSEEDWEGVECMLRDRWYQKPLDGVICCMSSEDMNVKIKFYNTWNGL
jgi:hypothetical protein